MKIGQSKLVFAKLEERWELNVKMFTKEGRVIGDVEAEVGEDGDVL